LAAAFGFGNGLDQVVAAVCLLALLLATVQLMRSDAAIVRQRLPLVLAAWLGLALLALAAPPAQEGWYGSRFFIPEQVALFWLIALQLADRAQAYRLVAILVVVALLGLAGLSPLIGVGNSYAADLDRDRNNGCMVYGAAALPRAGASVLAVADIDRIIDLHCRQRAYAGLGWGLAGRVVDDGDFAKVRRDLEGFSPEARRDACGGFYFVMAKRSGATPATFEAARREVALLCEKKGG
jgi:hypothetical protein